MTLIVNTPSQPVPVTVVGACTHLGVPLQDMVMLVVAGQGSCGAYNGGLRQMASDGTVAQSEFVAGGIPRWAQHLPKSASHPSRSQP